MSDWKPRLVALDVDGTLVNGRNEMSDAVREAVRATRAAGMEVVISTGRSVPGVMDTADKLGFDHGYAIGSNGSLVFTYRPLEMLRAVTFDASEAVRSILQRMPDVLVAVEEVGVGYRVNRAFPADELGGTITVQEVDELIGEPVTRVIVRSPEHSTEEFREVVADLGLTDTNYYIGYTAWLDIAPVGTSKASGLDFLTQHLGIEQADVLAVGDGNNDVEMLAWAGLGVAMGQALPEVVAAADEVTGTIVDDGVVDVLRRYL
ncbi:HAD family hydrolase [Aeromicrobium sp. Leaf350]|uniref:HAD family hydrolase n=1 Tax=Aeromicrobium sp. Leaf350 TaxID=2876565 RepID=UPI001E4006DF|nr:HAD family hydrolase [Aeromicrobium sp. Leaf350]